MTVISVTFDYLFSLSVVVYIAIVAATYVTTVAIWAKCVAYDCPLHLHLIYPRTSGVLAHSVYSRAR